MDARHSFHYHTWCATDTDCMCGQLVHSSAEAWLQTPMDTELWYNVTNRFNFLQINVLL